MNKLKLLILLLVHSPLCAADHETELIKKELSQMIVADQAIRERFNPLSPDESVATEMQALDQKHTSSLKQILATHQWITISRFGKKFDHDAWLLVQHASHDINFQKEVLSQLEKLIKTQETSPANYAYLYDRVAMSEGRPQRYGTQFTPVGGKLIPHALENQEQLDTRRSEVGLPPFNEYLTQIRKLWPETE